MFPMEVSDVCVRGGIIGGGTLRQTFYKILKIIEKSINQGTLVHR